MLAVPSPCAGVEGIAATLQGNPDFAQSVSTATLVVPGGLLPPLYSYVFLVMVCGFCALRKVCRG